MLDRLVVPLDGSPLAEAILGPLRPLLRRRDAEVLLVRSVHVPLSLSRMDTSHLLGEEKEAASAYLQEKVIGLASQGVRARGLLLEGPPAEAVLDAAAREKAGMIALSTHGRSGVARWIFGSVAEKIVRSSPLPVLVLRSYRPETDVPAGREELVIRRLLLPTDGSASSLEALPVAVELARFFEAEVVVLHVEAGPPAPAGDHYGTLAAAAEAGEAGAAEEIPRRAAQRVSEAGLRASTLNVTGDPAAAIVDLVRPHGADLIVMATHGRSGPGRWVLGSVTEKVLRAAPVPVVVVRSGRPPAAAD